MYAAAMEASQMRKEYLEKQAEVNSTLAERLIVTLRICSNWAVLGDAFLSSITLSQYYLSANEILSLLPVSAVICMSDMPRCHILRVHYPSGNPFWRGIFVESDEHSLTLLASS